MVHMHSSAENAGTASGLAATEGDDQIPARTP
jgi:hypothetical protein